MLAALTNKEKSALGIPIALVTAYYLYSLLNLFIASDAQGMRMMRSFNFSDSAVFLGRIFLSYCIACAALTIISITGIITHRFFRRLRNKSNS